MDPVPYAKLDLLPTNSMPWQSLEALLRKILHDVEGLRDVQMYGVPGQSQHGIDVVGVDSDGSRHAVQSKRHESFTKAKLTAAVDKFIAERGNIPFPVARFIVATGCLADRTEITTELYRLQRDHSDVRIELWHQRKISDKLRNRRDIVVSFFGEHVADYFCLSAPPHVVEAPSVDRVHVADALVRGPASITGAEDHMTEAAHLEETDPLAAADALKRAAEQLEKGGFSAHASVILHQRADLLARAGEYDFASRLLSDAFWRTLPIHDLPELDRLVRELNKVAATDTSRALARIATLALETVRHPLESSPAFALDELCAVQTQLEVARLLLLVAENSATDPNGQWRREHVGDLSSQGNVVADQGKDGAELAFRLRLEAADVSGDWTELLTQARSNRLPRPHCVLILARHAMYHAERGAPDDAAQSWEDAMTQACLDGQNDLAAEYVFSRRILRDRYEGLKQSDDVQLERSLHALGDQRQAVVERIEEKATRALLENKPHVAVPLLRAFHRAAYSSGSWGQLLRARELLADAYGEAREELLAARLFALAGQSKKAAALAKADPNQYLDVRACLSHPAYYVAAVGYGVLAEQDDLIPDEQVSAIGQSALTVLDDVLTGVQRDTAFAGPSIKLNALKALASLADRLPPEQAQRLLDHTRPWVPRKPNTYRRTDDDHVHACVDIATAHPNLRFEAIQQLMGLLDANDSGVSSRVERAAHDLVRAHPDLVRNKLSVMARQQNDHAARLLHLITDVPTPEQMTAAATAATRLRTPPSSTSRSVGIGVGTARDALLAVPLPIADRRELARAQLAHARAPYEPSHNRAEYFEAARILAHDIDDVDDLFDEAIVMACDRSASLGDVVFNLGSHPLGTFRSIGMAIDTRPPALFLSAALARSQEQKHRVRDLAYTLIGSSDDADWYIAQTLRTLDVSDDHHLPLLATQPHWALRSLAAFSWTRSTAAAEIGRLLAQDDDPRVRRALARAIASSPTNAATQEIRELLTTDPCYSIRKLIS